MLFAYPVASQRAQDVDNQKEWEVADTLGQIGGRGKIGGSYVYCQETKFIRPNVMRQIILKYAGIANRSVKGEGKETEKEKATEIKKCSRHAKTKCRKNESKKRGNRREK